MPNLYSSRHVVRILEQRGFLFISQKGSHAKYRRIHKNEILTVIVPVNRREIPHGTFRSILRQSHLLEEYFRDHK